VKEKHGGRRLALLLLLLHARLAEDLGGVGLLFVACF
jgi:hypothetical protein